MTNDDTTQDEYDSGEVELLDEQDNESDEPAPLTAQDVGEIVLYTLDWSVQSLLERIGVTFDVNPAFQRRDAWDRRRKSLYIESLIAGLPVPQIVLAEDLDARGRFIVLDGKQRLVTMKQFAAPDGHYRELRLKGMDFFPELEGLTFKSMSESLEYGPLVEGFLAQPVRTIVVRNWQRVEVLYQIFVRLNQGSVKLSPQELRQALFPGPFTTWVDKVSAASTAIHDARRLRGADFRMRDAEMLLRFIAFSDDIDNYRGNLRLFLDDACKYGNSRWSDRLVHYETLAARCDSAIAAVFTVFGENAFLRYDGQRYIRRFNVALFDAMSLVFADTVVRSVLRLDVDGLRAGYEALCATDEAFQMSLVSTTKTRDATFTRVFKLAHAVGEVIGRPLEVEGRLTSAGYVA